MLLKRYKWDFGRPVLRAHEQAHYGEAAAQVIRPFMVPFAAFAPTLDSFDKDLIVISGGALLRTWF